MAEKKNFTRVSHLWCGLNFYLGGTPKKQRILTEAVLKEFEKPVNYRQTPKDLVYNLFGINLEASENTCKLIPTRRSISYLNK